MPGLSGRALVVRICIIMSVLCTTGSLVGTLRGAMASRETQSLHSPPASDGESMSVAAPSSDTGSPRIDSELAEHAGFDVSHVVATDQPLGELFVRGLGDSYANSSSLSNNGGLDGNDREVTLIPLPAPVYLGLTGFAFVISVKFLRRLF